MAKHLDTHEPRRLPPPDDRRRRRRRIIGLVFVALVAVLIVSGVVAGRWYLLNRLPNVDGTFSHPSLTAEVTVVRDNWGVPHIEAATAEDAYFAYGFTVAQDRLFQMDLHRRIARGEIAALIASDETKRMDKLARTLLWRKRAQEILADETSIDPGFLRIMDAFLAGVNHCIATEPLPLEFDLLKVVPEPFTREDSIAFTGYMAYGFAEGIQGDTLYAMVQQRHPDFDVDALFPRYDREDAVTIMEGVVPRTAQMPQNTAATADTHSEGLMLLAREISALSNTFSAFHGSNSWVLGPSRTESGAAILANDPHIEFSNPHVWYEAHIRYGDQQNYGVHLPLVPFPMIAHNEHKAWALTMFENDDTDLYRETFDENDPTRVMYKGEWVPIDRWTETINVMGEPAIELEVSVTPHGPVITDIIEGYDGPPVSLWWGWLQAEHSGVDAFYKVGLARTHQEVAQALSKWPAPGLNVAYADSAGNIAWWAAARLPIRSKDATGKTTLDGASGNDEVLGYVPFEHNPQLINPPSGLIVTANNLSTVHAVGDIAALEGYWQPSDRAARILYLLNQQEKWTVEQLKAVQLDDYAQAAPAIVPLIVEAVQAHNEGLVRTHQQALQALSVWDYHNRANSIGASIYHFVNDAIIEAAAGDELTPQALPVWRALAEGWNSYKAWVGDEHSPIWDDVDSEPIETRNEIIAAAFKTAVDRLSDQYGENLGAWAWGGVHTIEFEHPLGDYEQYGYRPLRKIFNIGPYPVAGATQDVNNMLWQLEPYAVTAGPSMRLLIDYADLSDSQIIFPTGNSGHFMSKHFDDQTELFIRGGYRTINFTPEQIAANVEDAMQLKPR